MSLLVALPVAALSAVAYGASTAVEHSAAHTGEGSADAGGLLKLLRNPRWLLGMAGDTLGLILQVVALSTGPVILIQPILVLALPVSLPIARWLGGPRPGWPQVRACLWMILGLSAFFVLIGDPGAGGVVTAGPALITAAVMGGGGLLALVVVQRTPSPVKAATYGTVAGAWFGYTAVLLDAVSNIWQKHGFDALFERDGLTCLIILVVLGGASIGLLQVSFQIGSLAASFPANLAADPVAAVILGAILLHQDLPVSVWYVIGYLVCLAAILYAAIRLADEPAPEPAEAVDPKLDEGKVIE